MKRLFCLLPIMGMLCSSSTMGADWLQIGKNEEDGYVLYLDKASLVKKDQIWRAWFLLDFKTPLLTLEKKEPYLSVKELNYINCTDETKAQWRNTPTPGTWEQESPSPASALTKRT
jgi:hypothetical protein